MYYSIIDTAKGRAKGLNPYHHRLLKGGQKMVVNENELRRIYPEIDVAAASLGGKVLTKDETITLIKQSEK